MTVKQLIDELSQLDPDLRIFTSGYEGGFNDAIVDGVIRDFKLDYYTEWYYGPHERVPKEGDNTIKGIIL